MYSVYRNDSGRLVLRGTHRQVRTFVGPDTDYYTIVKG